MSDSRCFTLKYCQEVRLMSSLQFLPSIWSRIYKTTICISLSKFNNFILNFDTLIIFYSFYKINFKDLISPGLILKSKTCNNIYWVKKTFVRWVRLANILKIISQSWKEFNPIQNPRLWALAPPNYDISELQNFNHN
jgi:hypothetical protein